jgi:carotenoid cleavage dioxygenase-like enzyme
MGTMQTEVNPYLAGDYAPVVDETSHVLEVIEGAVPRDLRGSYVRNGPNPAMPPPGRYHWFDGDGMLHAVRFEDGRATYTNRFIRTNGLMREREAGAPIWGGLREPVRKELAREPYKDSSNTDVKAHGGTLVTTFYLCGTPYRVDGRSLETLGSASFARDFGPVSSHVKIDQASGEMMIFSFGPKPPFMKYGVVDRTGALVLRCDIPLAGVRLPHVLAFRERYSVLMDLNVFPDPAALAQ